MCKSRQIKFLYRWLLSWEKEKAPHKCEAPVFIEQLFRLRLLGRRQHEGFGPLYS
mgnify:CR=1 FL=1